MIRSPRVATPLVEAFLSTRDLAEYLRKVKRIDGTASTEAAWVWAKRNKVTPCCRTGRQLLFDKAVVDRKLAELSMAEGCAK